MNGIIVRDRESGLPTGLLHETAGSLVDAAMPAYSENQIRRAAEAASSLLCRYEVTASIWPRLRPQP